GDSKAPLRPGQALILPDLDFYFVRRDGGISLAGIAGRKIEMKGESLASEDPLERILGMVPGTLLLSSRGGGSRIAMSGKTYGLVGCSQPFMSAALPNLAVLVGPKGEALYSPGSWKVLVAKSGQLNHCASLDQKSGWLFIGDPMGMRSW